MPACRGAHAVGSGDGHACRHLLHRPIDLASMGSMGFGYFSTGRPEGPVLRSEGQRPSNEDGNAKSSLKGLHNRCGIRPCTSLSGLRPHLFSFPRAAHASRDCPGLPCSSPLGWRLEKCPNPRRTCVFAHAIQNGTADGVPVPTERVLSCTHTCVCQELRAQSAHARNHATGKRCYSTRSHL